MSTLSGSCDSSGTITWTISGLENPANTYTEFKVTTSDGKSKTWVASSGNSTSSTSDFTTGHACGITVTGNATAKWGSDPTAYPAGSASVPTQACPVTPPSTAPSVSASSYSGRRIDVSWNSVARATGYRVDAAVYGSGSYFNKANTSGTFVTITMDSEYTYYQIRVTPYNSGGDGPSDTALAQTPDETAPSVSASYSTGPTSITTSFNSSDSGSGVKIVRIYCNSVVSPSSYGEVGTSAAANYSLTTSVDGAGNPFKPNTTYILYVTAEDIWGNISSTSPTSVTTQPLPRPANFSWTTPKVSGQEIIMYASEWNALQDRINEFRDYKGVGIYSFFRVVVGNDPYGSDFNDAVSAISGMSPPTPAPGYVTGLSQATTPSQATDMAAPQLNGLVNSLNSIV